MKPTPLYATLLPLANLVLGSPTPMNELVVRKESKADRICTSNLAGDSPKGNLLCIDSTGDSTGCDVCMEHGSAKNGYSCYITTGSETELGRKTACPQDPAPKKNPDGSKSPSIAEDIVSAYCDVAGTGGAFGWLSYAGCFAWAFASEDDASAAEQAQNFAEGLCDLLTSGFCTCIDTGACTASVDR